MGYRVRENNGKSHMRWREPLFCVLMIASAVAASGSQDRPVRSDQQILIELERGWNAAFYRKDVSFIENILADEFVATYEDGSRGDKAKELSACCRIRPTDRFGHPGRIHGEDLRGHGGRLVFTASGRPQPGSSARADVSVRRRVRVAGRTMAVCGDAEHEAHRRNSDEFLWRADDIASIIPCVISC